MGTYVVFGTVYYEYSVTVEADDKESAREVAEGMPLSEWSFDDKSGLDVYEVDLVEE